MRLKLAAYIASEDWRKKYDYVGDFHDGFAQVKLNDKYGFVNTQGKEVVEPKYNWVWNFSEGFAVVRIEGNDKYGFVNTQGKEVVEPKYDEVWNFSDGFAQVKLKDKWGLVNTEGVEVVPPEYTEENFKAIPTIVRLLALRRNISEEEAFKLIVEEMAKQRDV